MDVLPLCHAYVNVCVSVLHIQFVFIFIYEYLCVHFQSKVRKVVT